MKELDLDRIRRKEQLFDDYRESIKAVKDLYDEIKAAEELHMTLRRKVAEFEKTRGRLAFSWGGG